MGWVPFFLSNGKYLMLRFYSRFYAYLQTGLGKRLHMKCVESLFWKNIGYGSRGPFLERALRFCSVINSRRERGLNREKYGLRKMTINNNDLLVSYDFSFEISRQVSHGHMSGPDREDKYIFGIERIRYQDDPALRQFGTEIIKKNLFKKKL